MEVDGIKSIVLINDSFPPMLDGVANTIWNYQKVLTEEYGVHAVVLTPYQKGVDYDSFPYPVYPYFSLDTEKRIRYRFGIPFSLGILKKLKENPPQLIHCHCPMTSMLFAIALRRIFDVPIILTYHTKWNVEVEIMVKNTVLLAVAMKLLKSQLYAADEMWTVSPTVGNNLKFVGYKKDYLVMGNGIDMPGKPQTDELISKYTAAFLADDDRPVFLFVGRHFWYKGFKNTLDALAKLKEDGVKFTFISIGDGWDFFDIERYAREVGLDEEDVRFLGAIHDREILRAWYSRADLFILPSIFDCFALVVLEAAANHTASVLIRGSDSSQGKTDGVNAFLIEENAESMYELLSRLSKDRALMKEVGDNASRDLFVSWSDSIKRAWARYPEVVKKYREGRTPVHKSVHDKIFAGMGSFMNFCSYFVK